MSTALRLLIEAGPLGLAPVRCHLTRARFVRLVATGAAMFVRGRYVVTARGHELAQRAA